MFTQILCLGILDNDDSYIDNVRELESEIDTALKEDQIFGSVIDQNVVNDLDPLINISGTKSDRLTRKIENNAIDDVLGLNVENGVLKNEISGYNPSIKHFDSDEVIPMLRDSIDVTSSRLLSPKESLLNGTLPINLATAIVDSQLDNIKPAFEALSDANNIISELNGTNLLESKIDDFLGQRYTSDLPKKKYVIKRKKIAKYKPLAEIRERGVVKSLLPERKCINEELILEPKEPKTVAVEINEIDKDETIRMLKSENDSLRKQIKLDSMKHKALTQSLADNIIKKDVLKDALNKRYPFAKRLISPKRPFLKHPHLNDLYNLRRKSKIAENIDNEISEANYDVQSAQILNNNAAFHEKAANGLKTSAKVKNIVARKIAPNLLGLGINDNGIVDKLNAISLQDQAEKEKENSYLLLGHALGKIENVGDTAIAENLGYSMYN